MPKYNAQEAIKRLQDIAKNWTQNNPEKPMGVFPTIQGNAVENESVVKLMCEYFYYVQFGRILYILNNSDSEYRITASGMDVIIKISFYR